MRLIREADGKVASWWDDPYDDFLQKLRELLPLYVPAELYDAAVNTPAPSPLTTPEALRIDLSAAEFEVWVRAELALPADEGIPAFYHENEPTVASRGRGRGRGRIHGEDLTVLKEQKTAEIEAEFAAAAEELFTSPYVMASILVGSSTDSREDEAERLFGKLEELYGRIEDAGSAAALRGISWGPP